MSEQEKCQQLQSFAVISTSLECVDGKETSFAVTLRSALKYWQSKCVLKDIAFRTQPELAIVGFIQ